MTKEMAGRGLSQAEAELVECYRRLETLLRERRDELAPF